MLVIVLQCPMDVNAYLAQIKKDAEQHMTDSITPKCLDYPILRLEMYFERSLFFPSPLFGMKLVVSYFHHYVAHFVWLPEILMSIFWNSTLN
nr:unnamed protein product [Callosobruchus analis]